MKSFHIAAYTFKADIICCNCIAKWAQDVLLTDGYTKETVDEIAMYRGLDYDAGVFGHRSEVLLSYIATKWNVDLEDSYSYDSDFFPKVVFADQVEDTEYCGSCHEVIP